MSQESSIAHLTECPICFERLSPPVDTCIKGHAVCQECRKAVTNCPTCRGEFSTNQNTLLNQMLETVPSACKYKSSGCSKKMILNEIVEHEKTCYFKEEKCCICEEKSIPFHLLNKHFFKHSSQSASYAIHQKCFQTFQVELPLKMSGYALVLITELKTHFLIRFVSGEENKIILSIQFTGEREKASNYFYELRIDQELPYKGLRSVFSSTGLCIPYFYLSSDWKSHRRAITLDFDQIFLSKECPQSVVITFQIKSS